MSEQKFDQIKIRPFEGQVSAAWQSQKKYDVVFQDQTRGSIRSSKTAKALLESGRYRSVKEVKAEPKGYFSEN